jgi:hypothetical protein
MPRSPGFAVPTGIARPLALVSGNTLRPMVTKSRHCHWMAVVSYMVENLLDRFIQALSIYMTDWL